MGGARGQAADIEIEARETLRVNDLLRDILAANTGQDPERIRATSTATSTWMPSRRKNTA